MSLRPQAVDSIPEETFRIAHAAFPKGNNPIMAIRDHLSQVLSDEDFLELGSGSTPHALIKFSTLFLIVMGYEQVKTVLMHCFIFREGQRFSHKST